MRTTLNTVPKSPRDERIRVRRELVRQFFIDLNLRPDNVRTLTIDANSITARVNANFNGSHVDLMDLVYDLREEGQDSNNTIELLVILDLNYLPNTVKQDSGILNQLDEPFEEK